MLRYKSHGQPHSLIMGWLAVYCAATPGIESADNTTVRLDLDNEPQPDALLRIDAELGGHSRISEDDYLEGAPELIVEIASSSASYDLHDKKKVYRRNGVQEYIVWRVGDRLKSITYSAADLLICPTRADNLPLVLQESMACGTPMVSFKVGGVPDLVRPGVTGYLAQPEDAQDFCNGIVQLLEDETLRERMSQNCRAIAVAEYPLELQAQRYIELYRQVLSA